METFATALRRLREDRKMTVSRLADDAGIQKGYVSMIEHARVNPPSKRVIESLERVLGITDGYLQRVADWERTPDEVRVRVEDFQEETQRLRAFTSWLKEQTSKEQGGGKNLDKLWKTGALRKKMEAVLGSSFDDDGGEETQSVGKATIQPTRLRIPLINKVQAGYPRGFTDLDYPARVADDYVPNAGVEDPNAFAATVVGDSMLPEYKEGDILIFSPAADVTRGSDCFVRLEPDHDTTFKRVYFEEGDRVRLQPLNPAFAPKIVTREAIAGMYRAVWKMARL